MNKNTSNQHCG